MVRFSFHLSQLLTNFFNCVLFSMYRIFWTPKHFKSATTGVASKTMRNELNRLVQTVSDPNTKRVCFASAYMLVSHHRGQGVRHGDAVLLLPLYALSH